MLTGGIKFTGKKLTPNDQRQLFAILTRTVGPYTARYIVKTVVTIQNGLVGELNLRKLLHVVAEIAEIVCKSSR